MLVKHNGNFYNIHGPGTYSITMYYIFYTLLTFMAELNDYLPNHFHQIHICIWQVIVELLELLESSVIGKQNTLVGLFLVTSTVATTSLVGYCQF